MKILKIFGLVVGIHVVAFMIVFAIPGCRSMSRHSPPPPAAVQAERPPAKTEAAYPQNDSTSPVGQSSPTPAAEPAQNLVVGSSTAAVNFPLGSSGAGNVRANPTRPGAPLAAGPRASLPESTPATSYVVVAGDNLSKIAKKHNLSSKEIAAANNLRAEAPLRVGQKLNIPGKAVPMSGPSSQPASPTGAETLVYKVKAGDSLAVIAKRAGTTPAAIRTLNHLKNDTVRVGQDLTLPAGSTAAASMASSPAEGTATASAAKSPDGAVHHIVKSGETLGTIAHHYGVKVAEIAVANNIADPLKVRAGQDLVIPAGKAAGSARSNTTPRSQPQPPVVENTPPTGPSSPVSSPVDASPIGPSTPPASPMVPPTVEVQEANPITNPKP